MKSWRDYVIPVAIVAIVTLLTFGALMFLMPLYADASTKVTTCDGEPPLPVTYYIFACSPGYPTDGLTLSIVGTEAVDTSIVLATVPEGPYSVTFNALAATFVFPELPAFECVPAIQGDRNKFTMTLNSPDGETMVLETWTRRGVPIAAFLSAIVCPPLVGIEETTWGQIRSLYK